ncbi:MAG: hypothetical protein GX620_06425 [Chloroflexi bacterium]|nr:hypothetical protein [Chloroflexota bacterium]
MTDESLQRLLDRLAEMRRVGADCFGKPVARGGNTIIPVYESMYAFNIGVEGETPEKDTPPNETTVQGVGTTNARPLAIIEITADDLRIRPIVDRQRLMLVQVLVGVWTAFWIAVVVQMLRAAKSQAAQHSS